MTVTVQRMCNSRIDRNLVQAVRFESVKVTIRDTDFIKYAIVAAQLFPPSVPETDILGEIIRAGIAHLHMIAMMDIEHDAKKEAKE